MIRDGGRNYRRNYQRNYRHRWGEKVARGRVDLGLSQGGLAEAAGVTQQAISAIERGESAPSEELKVRIARVLHQAPERVFPFDDVAADLRPPEPA